MAQTTEQRLANTHEMYPPPILELFDMSETTHQKFSMVDVDQPLFQPFPSEIWFQNYAPCETYDFPLALRNNDKIPRLVKVIQEDSPYFKVVSPLDVCNKVAPGMASIFHILFTPEENKDYTQQLLCITEREKFVIPVKAIGARAILDFPDQLNFSNCPVKCCCQKTLLVRNIGNREARFTLSTQSPFSVDPVMATLGIGDSMQVTVEFLPKWNGDHSEDLILHYDTGEDIYIALYGAASDVNVRLNKSSVIIEKTYVSLTNQRSLTIYNRSDIIVHYKWKSLATQEEEDEEKTRLTSDLQRQEETEMDRFLEECNADPTLRERISVLSRTFQNQLRKLQEKQMIFTDDVFSMEPAEGEIWPNSTAEVNILFKPKEAKLYQQNVYCDITGREARLSLRIKGEGIGPKLVSSFDKLDMGNIFVGSKHSYEVLLANKGDIDAIFTLVPPVSALGACFTFNPSEGIVLPGGFQAIHVNFSSGILGDFQEDFQFSVDSSPQNISITFSLRIPGDGSADTSMTSTTQVADMSRTSWRSNSQALNLREFTVTPSRGTIRSLSLMDVEVTLCSNTVKQYEVALVVDIEGVGEEVLALPILARCVIPPLRLVSPVLEFGRCFLDYPYHHAIKVANDSRLPACCGLLPQEYDEHPPVLYSSSESRGIVQPNSTLNIPLVLLAKMVGKLDIVANIAIFGSEDLPLKVRLACIGEGPVVHVSSMEVDFGNIPVLKDVSRTLKLSNQSPIAASYRAKMVSSRSLWRVEPCEGVVPREGETEISLVANVDDTVRFQDKLHLIIENSQTHTIPVAATGTGTTIVSDKPLAPAVNLGAHFSSGLCQYHFRLTNMGRRCHQLYWMTEGFTSFRRRGPSPQRSTKNSKSKNSRNTENGPNPVFKLHPMRAELYPGQSINMVLEGSSEIPKVVKERLICQAIIGKQSGKEQIMMVDVTCHFIAPVLDVSAKQLSFYLEKHPGQELKPQYKALLLRNVSSLLLNMQLILTEPYAICDTEADYLLCTSKMVNLGVGEEFHLNIRFDPTYHKDKHSWVAEESLTIQYLEHPQRDYVSLNGVVHYPNLHFSSMEVNFGCIVNDTAVSRTVEMSNSSPLPVKYFWSLFEDNGQDQIRDVDLQKLTLKKAEDSRSEGEKSDTKENDGTASPKDPSPRIHTLSLLKEVFDVFPVYGTLEPNESQQVTFTFYGRSDISKQVKALCEIEEGPTYELSLKGEASLVRYTIDKKEIDYGQQLFDQVAEAVITLKNTGRVNFEFNILNVQLASSPENAQPGLPLVIPQSGLVEALTDVKLSVYYLPGIPEAFHKSFEVQASYFEPEVINLRGEGIFPRICLDLPRNLTGDERYRLLLKEARESFETESKKEEIYSQAGEQSLDEYTPSYDCLVQMEVERLLMKEYALEQWSLHSNYSRDTSSSQNWQRKLTKCELPEYVLDFGYVIHNTLCTHIVKVTNTGLLPVSFHVEKRHLANTGFSTELDRVKNLPYCETETFEVRFDPCGSSLKLGDVDVLMPIQVVGGPVFQVRLHAVVTMPSLTLSADMLEFDSILCGQCQVKTIQLYNHLHVTCEWAVAEGVDKHIPSYLRRKGKNKIKSKPQVFEMIPSSGTLQPGERVNVQVKFSPTEEKLFNESLVVCISQSSNRLMLLLQGNGQEPQLDFSPSVLQFGPVLPYTYGDELEVTVKNPCAFPIEFYSLEFDKQYLEEEKILQLLTGYDSENILLLPPRNPGEKLPPEILEYFEEWKRQEERGKREEGPKTDENEDGAPLESGTIQEPTTISGPQEQASFQPVAEETDEALREGEMTKTQMGALSTSNRVGEIDMTPVSKANARHMGVDLSLEGSAARNRRGIAIIVHGGPLSGKTSTAVTLAKHYGIPCLNIDGIVLEAVANGSTVAGLQARELCAKAAQEQAQKKAEEAATHAMDTLASQAQGAGFLSVEAVTKHTSEGSQASEGKSTSATVTTMLPQRRLSISVSVAGETGLLSCVLPDDLLIEILAERLQLNDCHRGVVFDGLETLYSRSPSSALYVVLKAINNRKYIYMVELKQDYVSFKAREKAKKEEEEQILKEKIQAEKVRISEMDEEEYDALSEEERAKIDQKHLEGLRERKRRRPSSEYIYAWELLAFRELERLAKEQEEKRLQEELERQRMEEEMMRKKNRKGKKESLLKEEMASGKKSQLGGKQVPSSAGGRVDNKGEHSMADRKFSVLEHPDSLQTERSEAEEINKKKRLKDNKIMAIEEASTPLGGPGSSEDTEKQYPSESEKQLLLRFRLYEQTQKNISETLQHWDRVQGILASALSLEENMQDTEEASNLEQHPVQSGKRGRKDREREKERLEKEKEKERLEKEKTDRLKMEGDIKIHHSPASSPFADGESGNTAFKEGLQKGRWDVGVPHIVLSVTGQSDPSGKKVLSSGWLPSLNEVLDGLGLGPSGPPIPPASIFSVIPYPLKRAPLSGRDTLKHFTLLMPLSEENIEDKKELEAEVDTITSISSVKEDQVTPTKGRAKKDKPEAGRDSQKEKEKHRPSGTKKSVRGSETRSPLLGALTPLSDADQSSYNLETLQEKGNRLNTFRWIVPANGEVCLKIHFTSNSVGQFDQTLNFELLGTKRRYQLYCRGICAYPAISKDPKTVFPSRRKVALPNEIIQKKYILASEVFEFGPLLCGKSRDRYKEGRYPENMEKFTVHNNSSLTADVLFCLHQDTKATTFLLDPPSMSLKPDEKQVLTVWAFPTSPGLFEDRIVCCVKENPEPVIFKISCHGVRPELELDRKQLHFEKILLHRKETKTLYLRNNNLLPVAWKLTGLESLGDEFMVSQDQGILMPKTEYALQMHFRALKQVNVKKVIRLEVSDVDNILGIVYTENIQIMAEAYDVALDISFPKGADGGLDFGVIKVSEEAKQTLSLKNKGKYEISYSFLLETTEAGMPELNSHFTIQPQKGTLNPNDRPAQVQITFRSRKEVSIENKPILRCQVIEPNISEGGETIASIPVKLSIQSLFTRYACVPTNDLNFGSMMYGTRKIRTFTIENKGEFEIKYAIFKMNKDVPGQPQKKSGPGNKRVRSREGSVSGKSVSVSKSKRSESVQRDMGTAQVRFTLGVFTVSPGFGTIPVGGQQVITAECVMEQVGKCEELLAIDISDRDPEDHPNGIPYKLVTEGCVPGIIVHDIPSIFEEHRICKNIDLYQCLQTVDSGGIFVEDESKFLFINTLVGRQAKAQFKIINSGKIPCDVSLYVKPISSKSASRIIDIFEVEPPKMTIPSHSHSFAVVTFSPQTMQSYQCIFEAIVEGYFSNISRPKSLTFDITGDGNLPQVTVLRPVIRTRSGNPLVLFSRLLLGQTEKQPLVLKNEGTLPAQINIDLVDENGVFILNPAPGTQCVYFTPNRREEERMVSVRNTHTASLILTPGQMAEFGISFTPSTVQRYSGSLHLLVVDNQYEDSVIQIVGEGYQDEFTLDNIYRPKSSDKMEITDVPVDQDTVEAKRLDHIQFGDCHVGKAYQETFTMTNRTSADTIRFEWPADINQLKFFPQMGHVHAGCSKNVTVTFKSENPVSFSSQTVKCKISKITFQQPVDKVPDWDTRLRTVKWLDTGKESGTPRAAKKKVVETDPEPAHTILENTARELVLRVSAVCDFVQFKCKSETIHFKDTLLFQTRVVEFQITNTGNIQLEYSWHKLMETNEKAVSLSNMRTDSVEVISAVQMPGTRPGSRAVSLPASAIESVSSLASSDQDFMPFTIEPQIGVIDPGNKQGFLIKFSPTELGEYEARLICSIPNLMNAQGPTIAVKGRSLLPYCHFDLEDSDYIRSNKRNPEMRGPHGAPPRAALDTNTRVIEFSSVGLTTSMSRTFTIMNPTSSSYTFQWKCEDPVDMKVQPTFKCLTEKGNVSAQKKAEITFEFHPQKLEITESFWSFLIPEQNILVPFLLVGRTREPVVSLDRSHLNYKSLLIGLEARETVYLVNNEDVDFAFSFQENSRYSEGFVESLDVNPMEGSVPLHSRIPVVISYKPTHEGRVNFNLLCNVKRKSQPLTLNVKAEAYSMNANVQYENSEGTVTELSPDRENNISFSQVGLNEKISIDFHVYNTGRFILEFHWEFWGPEDVLQFLKMQPENGSVQPGMQAHSTLVFCPQHKCTLKKTGLKLKIQNGPTYRCLFDGAGVPPGVHFSFTKYDFGPNFIYHAGMVPSTQKLCITNKGDKEARIECLFSSTAHLEVDCHTEVLLPSSVLEIPITFYPREPIMYQDKIIFDINGFSQQTVEILGQGTEMKVEVEDAKHKIVNLGALRTGETVKKVIPVVNKSLAPVNFVLALTQQTLLDSKVLCVNPSGNITLKPLGGRCLVEIIFAPKRRMATFMDEVMMDSSGILRSLFALRGSCQGMEINLDQDYIPFGAVAQRSQATRRLVMQNTGDIGASFKWNINSFAPDFAIQPEQGYISPGMEVTFEVTFSPKELSQDIRYDNLFCSIEGGKPLKLTLAGSCVSASVVKEVVHFACQVRSRQTQTITLSNKTNKHCTLQPVIEGEYWSGPQAFTIEPQQNKPYEITYRPLTMTTDGKKHQGTVFFPFPDGTGLLYVLQGTADPPKAISTITREVPCKTPYSELLSISNWLPKPQRFRVNIELIKPEKMDATTQLKGLDYIDVPASAKRDYKLSFFSYKEGTFSVKVTFKNETTQEYLYYLVSFKATPPTAIGTIEMIAVVRQSASATVRVENPLLIPANFLIECKHSDISVPSQLTVPAQSEGSMMFEYQPLKSGEFTARLTLTNSDLGTFHYDLTLKAMPAGLEKPLYFRTSLGSSQAQMARFINFSRQKVEFGCKIDSPDFLVEKTINAAAGSQGGSEVCVEVCFEPCHLGETQGLLTISSPIGGEYTFPLFGTCTTPKAQGPFIIRAGSSTSIPFKNIFQQTTTFSFQVDNPFFSVKPTETIRSKKTHSITVSFEGNPIESKTPITCKMLVSCPRSEGVGQSITWVYYLRGITPEGGQREKSQ
ncbi:HYDIN protein, partial [Polypterus senegalus]